YPKCGGCAYGKMYGTCGADNSAWADMNYKWDNYAFSLQLSPEIMEQIHALFPEPWKTWEERHVQIR
ncbi:MAG: hypothetical protein KAH38_05960, partial [Candidatus Hydrogenedentes bacterium]|nr:hypothetical protein [Candidatus Hydrogenedentota bacterium]